MRSHVDPEALREWDGWHVGWSRRSRTTARMAVCVVAEKTALIEPFPPLPDDVLTSPRSPPPRPTKPRRSQGVDCRNPAFTGFLPERVVRTG